MDNKFADLETKAEMNSAAIGIITEIMGEMHTVPSSKVIEIARTLRDLNLAWNIKKPLLQTEAPLEINHQHCTIDLSKVESLVAFPLIDRGPICPICDCKRCSKIANCHILFPTTLFFCANRCGGSLGVVNCEFADEENAQ